MPKKKITLSIIAQEVLINANKKSSGILHIYVFFIETPLNHES